MNPYRTRLGSVSWLESVITDFKFNGPGWYDNGTILVIAIEYEQYVAHLFHEDPRPAMRQALELHDVSTASTDTIPAVTSS